MGLYAARAFRIADRGRLEMASIAPASRGIGDSSRNCGGHASRFGPLSGSDDATIEARTVNAAGRDAPRYRERRSRSDDFWAIRV
jgi:hypothetical protein